jgi:hypothetical protein
MQSDFDFELMSRVDVSTGQVLQFIEAYSS